MSVIRNTVIHNAENFGLVPLLEPYFGNDSTMEQELANYHTVYDIATYKKRRVCVTIKKYSVNKPHYIQFRLFTAKEKEDLKQVSYVNYTLNEFKELNRPSLGRLYVCLELQYSIILLSDVIIVR